MGAIKVTCVIDCVEVDGRDPSVPVGKKGPTIQVESHWSKANMVVLRFGDQSFTVASLDLAAAIENVTNRGHDG